MEPLAIKTPTFEQARDAFRGVWAEHRYADDCLMWMLEALHAEIADERAIVRGQAAVIAELRAVVNSILESLDDKPADACDAAMPEATFDAANYWTIRPDEPENFAANYPAAAKADPS